MKFSKIPSIGGCLTLSVIGTLIPLEHVTAKDVPPGGKFFVEDGDPVENYQLKSNSELVVRNKGATKDITAHQGSRVIIDDGRVDAVDTAGITLIDSSATIDNAKITATSTTSGSESYGIRLQGRSGSSEATVRNSEVSGVGRGINVTDSAILVLRNTDVIGRDGTAPIGPIAGGVGVVLAGASAQFREGSTVTGDNNGAVLFSYHSTGGQVDPGLLIDGSHVEGKNGSALLVSGLPGLVDPKANIEVANGSTLTGGNGVILEVQGDVTTNFTVNNSRLIGDVVVENGSTANLDLKNNASLTGTITNATSLTLDNSSLWVMEDDSTVGKLNLNGGMVDLRGTDGNASFHKLDVKELTGSGRFGLGTDLAAGMGDSLNVSGTATGSHKLLVENTGAEPQAGGADRQLVHIENGDAQFAVDSTDGLVDAGAYSYALEQRGNGTSGNDWFLVQTGTVSKSTEVAIGLFSAAPTVWYGESATLRSRMGELRTDSNQGGGWMRTYGNKYDMSAAGGIEYSQQQQGISFGADLPISSSNGQWLVGLMGGYSKSDLDLKAGNKGKVDSYYVGAYSTWLADNGFYIDALIKANRFQNSADVTMRDGVKSKGDYNNYGVGASVEVGKHITFNETWFVEPYAQMSGLWVSGEEYKLDNGLEARSNKADSLLGKVGSHLGRKFALDDGGFVQPYVKAAVAREFVTSNKVKINESRFTNDLSGTRAELGLGVAAQLTDVLQVHADFDYMRGRNIAQPWGVNVGVRYNW
ncbi:autotransporter outer membrane beta-barrel domain-containing protein [Pseudomonas folii]|uniref:Autotransporter outer membrane beta-barrel domain-containing protein n=1 Tax=Pseudomonas folii TaxID=2762593 RepID=A0ABR7B1A9_9PSED|nr:autotransporter outer membrane beta-barrel domain-containing protein [Pseudomonas folii]MBC3950971.1 autotransporter outer membrane beta-barrel domain-containing protein [Pseudomonas folii]